MTKNSKSNLNSKKSNSSDLEKFIYGLGDKVNKSVTENIFEFDSDEALTSGITSMQKRLTTKSDKQIKSQQSKFVNNKETCNDNNENEDETNFTSVDEISDFNEYNKECLELIKKISPVSNDAMNKYQISYKLDKTKYKKLVIFDLDETLIHCESTNVFVAEHIIDVNLPFGKSTTLGINIRPYAYECLKKLKDESKYDIICFTASIGSYANAVLDIIDKNNELFSYRIFRENCIKTVVDSKIVYIKDFRVFKNVDIKDIIIVDNSILSFAFNLDSGIPILPFYSNKLDRELVYLVQYLDSIVNFSDLSFENKKYIKYDESSSAFSSIVMEQSLEFLDLCSVNSKTNIEGSLSSFLINSDDNQFDEKIKLSNFSLRNIFK